MKKIFFYLWILLIMSVCSYNLTIHYIPNIVYTVFHYPLYFDFFQFYNEKQHRQYLECNV